MSSGSEKVNCLSPSKNHVYRSVGGAMVVEPISIPRVSLQAPFNPWYRPGTDHTIFERAIRKCRDSTVRLAKVLHPDDVHLLSGNPNCPNNFTVIDAEAVTSIIERSADDFIDRRDRSKLKSLSGFATAVSRFALNIQDIVSPLASKSPEAAIPLGCLMVIFKIVIAKQEKQEMAFDIFERLLQITNSLDVCTVLCPTDKMMVNLVETYTAILDLMVQVTEYCAIGRIVDALTAREKYNFDKGLKKVEASWEALRVLIQNASSVSQREMHDLLRDQAGVVTDIANQSSIMASNIENLRSTIDTMQLEQTRMHTLQVRMHSDSIINALLPSNRMIKEELGLWQYHEFRLSPKDHWEVNGVLDYLEEWKFMTEASILAVFGPIRDRDSWVTEFSLDTIQAFQVQNELVTFAMCDRPTDEHYTPVLLIKTIICQVLEQRPTLMLDEPDLFNSRAFQSAVHFIQACSLLERIIARLSRITIIIDRIDRCQPLQDQSNAELEDFLIKLVRIYGKSVSIIVTSAEHAPKGPFLDLPISICEISTWRNPFLIDRPPTYRFHLRVMHEHYGLLGNLFCVARRNSKSVYQLQFPQLMKLLEQNIERTVIRSSLILEERKKIRHSLLDSRRFVFISIPNSILSQVGLNRPKTLLGEECGY